MIKQLILLLIPFLTFSQVSVPDKYWVEDKGFEDAINVNSAFDDDNTEPVLIEFWAKFNEENCFADWDKVENVSYYRVDISKAPLAKKKYRVRMAPTLILFKDGVKEVTFKAGLDLLLPTNLEEVQEAINELNESNKF